MPWPSKRELEELGPPGSKESVTALLALPFLLIFLGVEIYRVWRGLAGEPLLIAGWVDPDFVVQWSASPILFILGMILHAVVITLLLLLLWGCVLEVQLWLHFRRR